jgi:glycolate oxidase
MIDQFTMRCIEDNKPVGLPLDAAAILIFGVDGNHAAVVDEDLVEIARLARAAGARDVQVAQTDADAERLWTARRSINPSLARRRPNRLGEDICVPRRAILPMIRRIAEIRAKYALELPLYGHIGDGNLHPNLLCDKRNPEEMRRVEGAAREIFEAAVALGGTLSGEHGIGLLKKQFMELDVGVDVLALMRRIKDAVDPLGIMNPGKIFPDPGGVDAFHLPTTER